MLMIKFGSSFDSAVPSTSAKPAAKRKPGRPRSIPLRHGHTAEYNAWANMMRRCLDPNHKRYADYGGRGIGVCLRWWFFENFLADMGPRPAKGWSLERIDNDGIYSPKNCRWVPLSEQPRNRRNTTFVDYNGERRLLIDVCRELGVNYDRAMKRHRAGLDPFAKNGPS